MSRPFFSVLVTTYNRAHEAERCIRSCLAQTFGDFEVVVVDDCSTDDTLAVLAALGDPRVRVVRHDRNRGISPARATSVKNAQGEWFVIIDSDWGLFPHTLSRLRELIETLPPGVRIIRSRLELDDGTIDPAFMPVTSITGYRERLLWLDQAFRDLSGTDAGHCMHRSVFETTNFFDRRGALEGLWELDLARRERSLWVPDVLGRQYADAVNSYTRDASARRVIGRLLTEAPDMLWMLETLLAEHGSELARYAPHLFRTLRGEAAAEAFLAGRRRDGVRHGRAALRSHPGDPKLWVTLTLGLIGPRALAYSKLAIRQMRRTQRAIR
jgi:glycosyltransferase involved in cell wall biosynthesis